MVNFPLRAGIVGPGIIWKKTHSKVLAAYPEKIAVAALCARTEETRSEAQAMYPGAKIYADYRDLARDPAIEAVVVLTPIAFNAQVALAALTEGKLVFLEKPIADKIEDAQALLRYARPGGVPHLYVLEQFAYPDGWRNIKKEVEAGAIGRVRSFDRFSGYRMVAGGDPSGYGSKAWRVNGEFPLGALFDGGIHDIAQLALLFGKPESVYAEGLKLREEHGEYDLIQMILRYESGIRGVFSHSGWLTNQRNYFYIRGDDGLIDSQWAHITVTPNEGMGEPKTIESADREWHVPMWEEILRAVAAGQDASYTPEDALREVVTLLAVKRSIETGRPVALSEIV
jgi:scyllo-inositol 2-dehydrogenase (NADP+)